MDRLVQRRPVPARQRLASKRTSNSGYVAGSAAPSNSSAQPPPTIDDRDHRRTARRAGSNSAASTTPPSLRAPPTSKDSSNAFASEATMHPHFLDKYLTDNGRLWHIWGGEDGAPPFTPDQSRRVLHHRTERLRLGHRRRRHPDLARRLGPTHPRIERSDAAALNRAAPACSPPTTAHSTPPPPAQPASTEYDPKRFASSMRRRPTITARLRHLRSAPRRPTRPHQPVGRHKLPALPLPRPLRTAAPQDDHYYRSLYRTGRPRRRHRRTHRHARPNRTRRLETAFKTGDAADAPNVITATPTLEMGIDIGDLSAVMLTGVPPKPANYIQRRPSRLPPATPSSPPSSRATPTASTT